MDSFRHCESLLKWESLCGGPVQVLSSWRTKQLVGWFFFFFHSLFLIFDFDFARPLEHEFTNFFGLIYLN